MSEATATVATEAAAPKAKKAPKLRGSPDKKQTAAMNKGRKTAKAAKSDKLKLPKPQRQVLDVLNRTNGQLPRSEIAARAIKAGASLTNNRISAETFTYATLTQLGFVKTDELETDGRPETVYAITPKGKAALAEWKAANKGKE